LCYKCRALHDLPRPMDENGPLDSMHPVFKLLIINRLDALIVTIPDAGKIVEFFSKKKTLISFYFCIIFVHLWCKRNVSYVFTLL